MADINNLPDEILVQIFHFYLQTETQSNFIKHVSNVCKKWKRESKDCSLLYTVDGSLCLKAIVNLAKAGYLKTTKTLKFGYINKEEKDQFYKTIYTNMPRLKHLDISSVYNKFNYGEDHPVLTQTVGLCPDLCELVLSPTDEADQKFANLAKNIARFLLFRGHNFLKLEFSGVIVFDLTELFMVIADNCPNLKELTVQNIKQWKLLQLFDIGSMQKGLPNLKTLRLGPSTHFTNTSSKGTLGFPNLEIFAYLTDFDFYFSSRTLEALFYNSPNLKVLDFQGCMFEMYDTLISLPAVNLEQLHISRNHIDESILFTRILQKWSHSLKIIEMSSVNNEKLINETFLPENFPNGLPKLQVLDASITKITECTLKTVIQLCPGLRSLNLMACESLESWARNIYHSRSEIEDLLLKLDENKMDGK